MRRLGFLSAIVVFAFFVSAPTVALAAWGVKGGLSLASQEFDPLPAGIDDVQGRVGLYAAFYVVPLELGPVRLVAELGYAQKGMTSVERGTRALRVDRGDERQDNRLDYASLSVLAQLGLFGGPAKPYVAAGPRFDVLLGHDAQDFLESVYDGSKSVSLGADVAGGVRFANLLLEARYSMDLGDSFQDPTFDVTNSTVLLLAGFEF
jgi:hypothetical protein